ncbi:MAG: ABC transporter permease [Actinobacteria bacterium]|nr:ABC transporter permease [Actinomycetota bacterium]
MAVALSDSTEVVQRRRSRPLATVIPLTIVVAIALIAVVGPFFTPDAKVIQLRNAKRGLFTPGHLLGTDAFGRDILARVVEGARVSLTVGIASVGVCILVGGGIGMIAGYRGGVVDAVLMRLMDIILAFPSLVLALTIAAFLGPSIRNVVLAVAFSQLPHFARLSRATTISIREREFVLGSSLLGARHGHILRKHIVPNIAPPLITYGLLAVGIAILVAASLSFLGLGVRPPTPSWGSMIAEGRPDLDGAPHIALVPGAMLFITILSLNLVADSVRSKVTSAGGGA